MFCNKLSTLLHLQKSKLLFSVAATIPACAFSSMNGDATYRNKSSGAFLRHQNTTTLQLEPRFRCSGLQLYRKESSFAKGEESKGFYDRYVFPEPPALVSEEEHNQILNQVNECIVSEDRGRLFAIVQVSGKQYKVTQHDLIQTVGQLSANLGDKIRLEKVLLVGGQDFTLVGQPLIRRSLVKVEATIVEHTPGAVKIVQAFKRKINFQKRKKVIQHHSVLRINSIEVYPGLE